MPRIETVLSPALFDLYKEDIENKIVIVIDILRATTTMIVALENGAKNIIPVENLNDALSLRQDNFLIAGERNGVKVDGFDLGNSPQDFTPNIVANKTIVLSTTNGTRAIQASYGAKEIYAASFRNLDAMANYLINQQNDVILFCAGWKDKVNLEDTIFAGALIEILFGKEFQTHDDSTYMALNLWKTAKKDLVSFLSDASHVKRFKTLHIESDLKVCLQMNTYDGILKL